jgi:glycerol-3-phosphate acyltransferase PlsX
MNIALDLMGGDYAPAEAFAGVVQYLDKHPDGIAHLVLIGEEEACRSLLPLLNLYEGRYTFVPSGPSVGMHEHPTRALKDKPDSSIATGYGLMKMGKADVFCGAGNTGAMMVGALYTVKALEGIQRPTIVSPLPRIDGKYNLLLDVGINADCKPENLVQFAELGSLYVKHVFGVENPRVGLLNIGEEEGKGNILAQSTYPLLKDDPSINFIGNVEGRDLLLDKADVIVCEGFVGNAILKMAESIYDIFGTQRGIKDDFMDCFNYEMYGGTPVLGLNSPVLIGHGISPARAFCNMIQVAEKIVASKLIDAFRAHFKSDIPQG